MADIHESISDNIEHGRDNLINSLLAFLVAITATFMALCNVKDGNVVQVISQAQTHYSPLLSLCLALQH